MYCIITIVTKLFNDYSKIVYEAKNKAIYGEGLPLDLACIARVAKVSDRKVFNHKQLKILTPKINASKITNSTSISKTSENLLSEIVQIIFSLYRAKETTKKV